MRRKPSAELPPLFPEADTRPAKADPELEQSLFTLVTAVGENEGMAYPLAWLPVVQAAKVRGYIEERRLKLYLRQHGEQFLKGRASGDGGGRGGIGRDYTMTKVDKMTRLQLKDLARDTGVPMQEAIGLIIGAVHEHRDALTRVAHAAGEDHPWEAIRVLLRGK